MCILKHGFLRSLDPKAQKHAGLCKAPYAPTIVSNATKLSNDPDF